MNVFISYQTTDKIVAGKLKNELSGYGIEVFLADEDLDISVEWQDEILRNLENSSLFICLLSQNYLNSFYCIQESGMALILKKTIIPLSIDDTISPGFISKYQSKRITSQYPSIKDIIPGLLKFSKDDGIRIIIDLIGKSGSFKSAEENFGVLSPYIDQLSNNDVSTLIDKIFENSQINSDHLCVTKYIPQIMQRYKSFIELDKYQELQEICDITRNKKRNKENDA